MENVNITFYIYILRCENNILYTGITTDYIRRFNEHISRSKKSAKFTKSHRAEKIVAIWKTKTRSNALKLEAQIKKLTKNEKELLIESNMYFRIYFSTLFDCRKYRRMSI